MHTQCAIHFLLHKMLNLDNAERKKKTTFLLVCHKPGGQLEADDVLDLGQHVLVHFMRQVSNRQEQIFDFCVCRVATEDDVSSCSSHTFFIDAAVLVINPVYCPLHLQIRCIVLFHYRQLIMTQKPDNFKGECNISYLVGHQTDVISLQSGEGDGAVGSHL